MAGWDSLALFKLEITSVIICWRSSTRSLLNFLPERTQRLISKDLGPPGGRQ